MTTDAEIIHLTKPAATPMEVSQHMGSVARDITSAVRPIHAAFTIFLTDGAPIITAVGMRTWDDIRECYVTLNDYLMSRYGFSKGEDEEVAEYIERKWNNRQDWKRKEAERVEALLAESPWVCEWCSRRYKTERGCVSHETLHCYKNPKSRLYTSGDYTPTINADGKVVGSSITEQGWAKAEKKRRDRRMRIVAS